LTQQLLTFVKSDFQAIQQRRSGYSLRSYARHLGISPTSLSLFLRGKRNLSRESSQIVHQRLGLMLPANPAAPRPSVCSVFEEIDPATFRVIADWQYFAIVALAQIEDFSTQPEWIAKRLNISASTAQKAVEDLIALELLALDANGKYRGTDKNLRTTDRVASLVVRRNHEQFLDLAQQSLQTDSLDERNFSGITMAIDPTRLPQAITKIRNFRRRLCAFLEGGNRQEVYRIAIQLFPLSRRGHNGNIC